MLFNSLVFLAFLCVVLLVYPWLNRRRQNVFLLIASYYFYGSWDWRFTSLLAISTVVDYFVGARLSVTEGTGARKRWLTVSILVNLGILGFFKYFNFFVDSTVAVLAGFGLDPHEPTLNVVLPVGISFYTFQTMSYTIDIYKRKMEPTLNFIDFALFVSFFPQLVAGPIERAKVLLPQIAAPRTVTRRMVLTGLNLMILGYFKKVFIADTMAPLVSTAFNDPGAMNTGQLLTGLYAFCFQIYGDFSGYSDIARGVARLLGFELMINFEAPYTSRSITEFWRRWHISLSSWLRDYLYISLGGNRQGKWQTYRNLFLTMFLGGLWHGAAWTMAIWGVMHGVYLAVHKMMLGDRKLDLRWPSTVGGWIRDLIKIVITFHLVALTWIMFRASSFTNAREYIEGIASLDHPFRIQPMVLAAAAIMVVLDILQNHFVDHTWVVQARRPIKYAVIQIMLISCLAASIYHIDTVVPFIYFQF